ncbi:DUF6503 family protein [Maribacter flavus]|uniref:DUF1329 domain-containing protein n=1 Tax=Maribacter flavus TaxID=1658664 RepID=A0A5B2TM15_9FLAO|nr:DUF6503 family protein [Maribacter flavus]KAA2215517.1 hypothetical protein F0361_17945 [Maribacter flavus]
MIKQLLPICMLLLLMGCKEAAKEKNTNETIGKTTETSNVVSRYPEAQRRIFDAHGTYGAWKEYKTLSYEIGKEKTNEIHVVDLPKRMDLVTMGTVQMGFDGTRVWLADPERNYQGDPVFYHNLMFYFYAMPFVLGDEGINYGDTADLLVDGKSFPGISVTYDSGVGTSPKDEYYLHYDPETFQMAWLGYTVTYRTGEDSDTIKWIRYDDWQKVGDLVLPKSISWVAYEGREMGEIRNTVQFENVELSKESKPNEYYAKPEAGVFVEGKSQD